MKSYKQIFEEIENNKNKLKNYQCPNDEEIEKLYIKFYDMTIKNFGYCNKNFYDFKKDIIFIYNNIDK